MIKQSLFDSSHNEIKNYGDLVTSFNISNSSYYINSASENRVHGMHGKVLVVVC